jgi:hypothetical protein
LLRRYWAWSWSFGTDQPPGGIGALSFPAHNLLLIGIHCYELCSVDDKVLSISHLELISLVNGSCVAQLLCPRLRPGPVLARRREHHRCVEAGVENAKTSAKGNKVLKEATQGNYQHNLLLARAPARRRVMVLRRFHIEERLYADLSLSDHR